ncbi:hypothetical protein AYO21_04973 [Fonsecaea monophora]|uniref:Amine oxidase n=1 Tax=Fonsecaea monophora TaxID=254056 RepID=A0A177FAQ8_9EURO|nr:hypothetical protein AYO21_04973 [Fonsecaea monophora]OAG40896.1 hypothetical protein AYO21_04973 [Fonsecaea monophora]
MNLENTRLLLIGSNYRQDTNIEDPGPGLLFERFSPFDMPTDEVVEAKRIVLTDPDVRRRIAKLSLPADAQTQCDTWPYSADKLSIPEIPRLIQAMLYGPESDKYSFPIPMSPVIDMDQQRIVRVDELPSRDIGAYYANETPAEALSASPMAHCIGNENHPSIQYGNLRKDLKPLSIIQPEGTSFKVQGETVISWQKWQFRLAFNWREGTTIHNVRYDNRELFYRLSLSEMTVPYGGSIQYFNFKRKDSRGGSRKAANVVCLREQVRPLYSFTLSPAVYINSMITVGNYEYVFSWLFSQSGGTVEFETRATGILATSLIDAGQISYWDNVVSPGVLEANHQHLFCLRVDPMIDGSENTVVQQDSVLLPLSETENPLSNTWQVVQQPIEKSLYVDAAAERARVIKIVNEKCQNPTSGKPVGFKLVQQLDLLFPSSLFANLHPWSRDAPVSPSTTSGWPNGVVDYSARNEDVRDQDLVLWHTHRITYNPSVEDYPVMPCEIVTIALKPADFFLIRIRLSMCPRGSGPSVIACF